MTVTPEVNKVKGTVLNAPANAETEAWTGTSKLSPGTGSSEVNLVIECKKEPLSPCPTEAKKATVADVDRVYAASKGVECIEVDLESLRDAVELDRMTLF